MPRVSTPSRRRPTVPPLSELDAPGRTGTPAGTRAGRARARRSTTPAPPTTTPPTTTPTETGPAGTGPAQTDAPGSGPVEPGATGSGAAGSRAGTRVDAPTGRAGTARGGWERGVEVSAPGVDPGAALWTPRPEADELAPEQRAVAEERAALARAVLAEQAAAAPGHKEGRRPLPALAVLAAAAALLAARLWLVGTGALFGTGPVRALDATIAVTAALGLVLVPAGLLPAAPGRLRRPVAVLGVPALLVAGTVLLQPATPAFAPASACPAAPVRGGTATAVTTAPAPTRSGPGRGYPATGLLPAGCAVGVTGYCLGDSLPAAAGWADNRWLLVGRQRGPAALVSRHVSGEPELPRFLPPSAAAPAGPDLPLLPAADCGAGALATPGPTSLEDLVPGAVPYRLVARAARAANVGFAVWVTADPPGPGSPLLRGGQYRQVSGGAAGPAGVRATGWDFQALLLDLGRAGTVTVAVLAVGCEAPAAPAATGTAMVTTYQIVGGRLTEPRLRLRGDEVGTQPGLAALDADRLAAEACAPPR